MVEIVYKKSFHLSGQKWIVTLKLNSFIRKHLVRIYYQRFFNRANSQKQPGKFAAVLLKYCFTDRFGSLHIPIQTTKTYFSRKKYPCSKSVGLHTALVALTTCHEITNTCTSKFTNVVKKGFFFKSSSTKIKDLVRSSCSKAYNKKLRRFLVRISLSNWVTNFSRESIEFAMKSRVSSHKDRSFTFLGQCIYLAPE